MNVPVAARRKQILDAATEVFAERGFYGAQVPEIAARARVGVGTIYRHFDDKLTLVNAVYADCKTRFMETLLEEFPWGEPPRAQFGVFWRRMASFALADPRAFDFLELHHHQPYLSDANRALELRALAPVAAFVLQASEAGLLEDAPAALLISFAWGAFVGMVKAARMGHLELSAEAIGRGERCCWDALRRITHEEEGR